MRVEIFVAFKPSVLDPQGQAVAEALGRGGFSGVASCRVGKTITLDLDGATVESVDADVKSMCDAILVNAMTETYTYKIIETA